MASEEADLFIKNCLILPTSRSEIIKNGMIAVKDGFLSYVGDATNAPKIKAENVLEGHGKIATPGLVNCHTHLPMTSKLHNHKILLEKESAIFGLLFVQVLL